MSGFGRGQRLQTGRAPGGEREAIAKCLGRAIALTELIEQLPVDLIGLDVRVQAEARFEITARLAPQLVAHAQARRREEQRGILGMRGQLNGGGPPTNRNASVREDPAQRRINGGGKGVYYVHLIPMTRPEIVITANGPAVFHGSDFSLVTAAKPAKAGEVLIVMATGLGPTRPGVDPGQPFPPNPANPLQVVNSPVDVTVNGQSTATINAVGWPTLVDVYRVDFQIPSGTGAGMARIQLTAAWIPGSSVSIPIQ